MQNTYVNKQGFTIVELLIVIVVMAILAVISVAAYSSMQEQARSSALKSDFAQIKKKLSLYRVEHGRYPRTNSELIAADLSLTKDVYATELASYIRRIPQCNLLS